MITGSFKSIKNKTYKIEIDCDYTYEIGSSDEIQFSGDSPIAITQDVDNTFDTIIKTKAEINLVVKSYLGVSLFTANDRYIIVKIYKDDNIIFYGYVEPASFNQDFAEVYTDFTLNCYDWLCTLENHQYREDEGYADVKSSCNNLSFKDILLNHILAQEGTDIKYDQSINLPDGTNIFKELGVNETLFIGESEDDLWTQEDILDEMLKYLNLHIVMMGKTFFIFNWGTIRNANTIKWINLSSDTLSETYCNNVPVDESYYASDDTQISINEIYNKLQLTCDLQSQEDIFEEPLDDDNLTSPYINKQKYMIENGKKDGDIGWIKRSNTSGWVSCFEDGTLKSKFSEYNLWYIRYYENPNWVLRYYDTALGELHTVGDLVEYDDNGVAINQANIFNKVDNYPLCPVICGIGNVSVNQKDNSKTSEVSLENNLCIHVGGTESSDDDEVEKVIAKWNLISEKCNGIVEYNSKSSTSLLSPTDDGVTNYIVFNGKITLTHPYNQYSVDYTGYQGTMYRYESLFDWYDAKYPNDAETLVNQGERRLFLTKQYWKKKYGDQMKYREKTGEDTISKVPILVCQLQIGDKYCVETDGPSLENPNKEATYKWFTEDECANLGYEPTFTIGINPAVNDYFFEKTFDIENTLDIKDNVEGSGTAIPIKKSDNLGGKMTFKILSPSFMGWPQQVRKHPTAFSHSKWWTVDIPFMNYVDNIWIEDFTCKLYSDNGNIDILEDNDLVYESDENTYSVSRKDDIEFKFNTAITSQEARAKGVSSAAPQLSNIFNIEKNIYISGVTSKYSSYGSNTEMKPEEHYINDYYEEYSTPKIEISTTFHVDDVNWLNRYSFSYFNNKEFYIYKQDMDLKAETNTITLKEI